MSEIERIEELDERTLARLIDIWESAVRETHLFLSEEDIINLKPEVHQGLSAVEFLFGYSDDEGILQGFIGIDDRKIEMLFVDNYVRGQGIGKQLVTYAVNEVGAKYVDVNEQNEQGVGFYKHVGFHVVSRSDTDDQGRPFPLLHLQLQ